MQFTNASHKILKKLYIIYTERHIENEKERKKE